MPNVTDARRDTVNVWGYLIVFVASRCGNRSSWPRQVMSSNIKRNASRLKVLYYSFAVIFIIIPAAKSSNFQHLWRVSWVEINFTRTWCSKMKIRLTTWRGGRT